MNKDRLNGNCKLQYSKPKIKIVKPIFSNAFTTSAVATSHKKNELWNSC